jgi:hypothetical protein
LTPKVGVEYVVELETNELRRWGTRELDVAEMNDVGIRAEDGEVVLHGYLETAQLMAIPCFDLAIRWTLRRWF